MEDEQDNVVSVGLAVSLEESLKLFDGIWQRFNVIQGKQTHASFLPH